MIVRGLYMNICLGVVSSKIEDPASIAKCMREAYGTSKEELSAIGQRGFEHAISKFSKGVNLKILVDACKSVIEN